MVLSFLHFILAAFAICIYFIHQRQLYYYIRRNKHLYTNELARFWLLMCKYGNNPHLNQLPKDVVQHIAQHYLLPNKIVSHPVCAHRLVKNNENRWVHDIRLTPQCEFENQWYPHCYAGKVPTFKCSFPDIICQSCGGPLNHMEHGLHRSLTECTSCNQRVMWITKGNGIVDWLIFYKEKGHYAKGAFGAPL